MHGWHNEQFRNSALVPPAIEICQINNLLGCAGQQAERSGPLPFIANTGRCSSRRGKAVQSDGKES